MSGAEGAPERWHPVNAFILNTLTAGGYLGVFLLMAIENVIPPIPSEVIMGYGGVLVERGQFKFWPLLIIGTTGTVVGNCFWYWLGRRWDEDQLHRFADKYGRWLTVDWKRFQNVRRVFRKHGDWVVFVLRFSPFFRTIISLPAGLAGMNIWRFMVFTFLGSLIWNGLLIWGGGAMSGALQRYDKVAGYIVIGFVVLGVVWYIWRVVTWNWREHR